MNGLCLTSLSMRAPGAVISEGSLIPDPAHAVLSRLASAWEHLTRVLQRSEGLPRS